jgi:hypothetical protein
VAAPTYSNGSVDELADRARRQRNWFAVGAVAMFALAMAVSLPRRVQRYRLQYGLNRELIGLQAQIGELQRHITEVEKKITAAQQEIKMLNSSGL